MRIKKALNRIDTIKDPIAKREIACAHAMISLLGAIIIVLVWTMNSIITIVPGLVLLATVLLAFVILLSAGITYSMLKSRK